MALPAQNTVAWKACTELLHILAIIATVYRLVYRFKFSRLWWDDYLVVVPLLGDLVYSTAVLIKFQDANPSPGDQAKPIFSYWLSTFLFLLIVWSTRMVLSLSLSRVFPDKHPGRIVGLGMTALFGLTFLSAVLVTTLTCETLGFVKSKDDRCIHGVNGYNIKALYMPLTDFISDILLVMTSVFFLSRLPLSQTERYLILTVFSASILTMLSVLVFAIASFSNIDLGPDSRFLFGMFASLEVAVSLVVCNTAIIITSIYRALRKEGPAADAVTERDEYRSDNSDIPSDLTFTDIGSNAPTVDFTQSPTKSFYDSFGSPTSSTNNVLPYLHRAVHSN
ncbi:hypothetical protein FA15DRAFT_659196 [Coprinopsis marcescibilis]|uniref:Rhodopsin domain-containing protein n=1 Tax=Coprinopsis marcescibilis TaxID=230819 RepID=A0A5C3KK56_COPMA|nr:hypothetical protein FA15DRAFT_659196 [Coprinopsis marcescibilis]